MTISCKKESDVCYPDVEKFVQQLKNGTYDNYKLDEKGEKLWLVMPSFTGVHIQSFIDYEMDTSRIIAFPANPVSSRSPFPPGRDYFILSESLLWTVEGIRNGKSYGSLDPYLIDNALTNEERYKGLTSVEILAVRDLYQKWWTTFKNGDWKNVNPLVGTFFQWF